MCRIENFSTNEFYNEMSWTSLTIVAATCTACKYTWEEVTIKGSKSCKPLLTGVASFYASSPFSFKGTHDIKSKCFTGTSVFKGF